MPAAYLARPAWPSPSRHRPHQRTQQRTGASCLLPPSPPQQTGPGACAAGRQRMRTHPPRSCPTPRSRFRESGFYISHTPEENDASEKFYGLADGGFKDAVLDLTAEDAGARCVAPGAPGGRLLPYPTAPRRIPARHKRGVRRGAVPAWLPDPAGGLPAMHSDTRLHPSLSSHTLRRHEGAVAGAVPLGQAQQEVRQAAGGGGGQGGQAAEDGVGRQGGQRRPGPAWAQPLEGVAPSPRLFRTGRELAPSAAPTGKIWPSRAPTPLRCRRSRLPSVPPTRPC